MAEVCGTTDFANSSSACMLAATAAAIESLVTVQLQGSAAIAARQAEERLMSSTPGVAALSSVTRGSPSCPATTSAVRLIAAIASRCICSAGCAST
jgi:phosphotransacetylase